MIAFLGAVSLIIGLVGGAVVLWGVIVTTMRLPRLEARGLKKEHVFSDREALRHQLGSYLLLGLEFLLAADIIRTIIHPTLQDMAILGSIVAIRTVINYFLDKEIASFRPGETGTR